MGLIAALALLLALMAAPAAAAPHEPLGSFGPDGTAATEFKNNAGLAFAEAQRRLFVADLQTDKVWGFNVSSPPPPFPGLAGFSPLTPPASLQGEYGLLAADNTASPSAGRLYLTVGAGGSGAVPDLAAYGPSGAPPAGFPVAVAALANGQQQNEAMAVDPRNGDIVTLDRSSKSVRLYSPAGYRLDDLLGGLPGFPSALAFDTEGDLYLVLNVSASVREIRKYYAASGYGQSTQVTIGPVVEALALDSATHHLYAAYANKVAEYDAEGDPVEEFAEAPGAKYRGLAVDPANHHLYVSDAGAKGGEKQKVTIKNATGGTYELCFDPDEGGPEARQCTGATGKGSLAGPAAGTGDVVRIGGLGNLAAGSHDVTHASASGGQFAIGMAISGPGIPGGTTIIDTNPEAETITLSKAPSADRGDAALQAGYIANLETSSGEFRAGMEVFGPGIPESGFPKPNVIASVNGDGTLTLQGVPSAASSGAALTASSKTITGVLTESGAFVEGEAIAGAGIPAGATIACVGRGECPGATLGLSAPATASATATELKADMPYDMAGSGIASALQRLAGIGPGNIGASGSGSASPIERTATFGGDFLGEDVALLEADGSGLSGSSPEIEVETSEAASVPDPGRVRVYSAGQIFPALRLGEPTALEGTSVTLHGAVNPEGLTVTDCHFDYVTEAAFAASGFSDLSSGASVSCTGAIPADGSYHDVSADLSGLEPGIRYRYRIVVETNATPPASFPGGAFATPAPPAVETTGSPVPSPTEAILSGRIDTRGQPAGYRFEYGAAGPCDANPCASTPTVAVRSDEVQGFSVVHSFGPYTLAFEGSETPPLSPDASAEEVQTALEALATIGAGNVVISGGSGEGSSHFVVSFGGALAGTDLAPLSVTRVEGSKAGIAETPVQGGPRNEIALLAARVGGLEADATYHYRLVAEAGEATVFGADMTLRTRSTILPTNPDFAHPPGSERAYELVSLPDSGGNPSAFALGFAADGEHALYQVSGGTPISQQGSFYNQLLADRTETAPHTGEWRSRLLAPAEIYGKEAPDWFFAPAPDFSRFIGKNNNGTGGGPAIHLWRIAPGGPYQPLRDIELHRTSEYFEASADASRVVAVIKDSLDPANPVAGNRFHLYDVSDPADPRLLSAMPGAAAGCGVATQPGDSANTINMFLMTHDADHRGWVSDDGSRAYFVSEAGCAASPLQLYEREIEAETTKLISGPPLSGPSCPAAFVRATDDAVFFLTAARLAAEDVAPSSCSTNGGQGGDVYRYALADGQLRCVTCAVAGSEADLELLPAAADSALGVVGVSEDGSAVYFASPNRLLPGAAPVGIYRADVACELGEAPCPAGPLAYVAPGGGVPPGTAMGGESVVSADGEVLVFKSSDSRLSAQGGARNDGLAQYYRYDDADRSLTCLTCPPDGSSPRAAVSGSAAAGTYTYSQTYNGTMVSADGSVVAFSSPSPLLGADQNTSGLEQNPYSGTDVYEWRGDHAMLITDGLTQWNPGGRGQGVTEGTPEPAGVSPSGDDVFFFAAARLTPEAIDDYERLYDARLGGGFIPATEPQPCPLEACQGTPQGAPEEQAPGSRDFRGAGNPSAPAPPCRKGKVRRGGRCAAKHHRKHKAKRHQKRAGDQRGAQR